MRLLYLVSHVQVNVSRATVVVSRAILVFSRATVVVSCATLVFSRVMKLLYLVSHVQVNVSRATLVISRATLVFSRATLVFSRVMTWKVQPEGEWVLVARIKFSVLIFYSACAYRDPAAKGPVSIYHLGWAGRICNSPYMNFVHPPLGCLHFSLSPPSSNLNFSYTSPPPKKKTEKKERRGNEDTNFGIIT